MRSKEYKVIKALPTLARIGHTTKQIEVSPDFAFLSKEMQSFILFNLEYLVASEYNIGSLSNQFNADQQALNKVMELFPNRSRKWWIVEVTKVLLKTNIEYNQKRVNNLINVYSFTVKNHDPDRKMD